MSALFNLLRRALARIAIHLLEVELHDQTTALQHVTDVPTFRAICSAREGTQRDLLKARQHYLDLLPPGERRTWSVA